jgi:hypothetical protein
MIFIFLVPVNGIDFLRRYGEGSHRRVVCDIGAAIDITTMNDFFAGGGQQSPVLRGGVLAS